MDWIALEDMTKIEGIINESHTSRIVLFKHSTSCGISRMVLRNFEREIANLADSNTSYYFIDLIVYRAVSNEIAQRLKVQHESPQLIVLEGGEVVHHSSHSEISAASFIS